MTFQNDTIFVENPEWSEGVAHIGHETVLYVLPQSLKQVSPILIDRTK